jgi:TP901 family phage tail tape measure protein
LTQRTVAVKVTVLAQDYFAGMAKMRAETKSTTETAAASFAKQKAAFTELGHVALGVSGVMTVAFLAMVKASADFEQRMSQVQALSKATSTQMSQLRNAAFTAGQAFGLSATQVADAQIELTKAGVSVKDIIGGALPGALALAAAGQIDVAKATEIASNAMTEFKLKGADVPHIADLLAAGADKSVASVESLGDALNQSGLVAAQFGLSVEDTVGTLTAFSKAGLNGSDAGTSFKTMLLALASPSKQAQKYLDEYNITAYDSQGAFVGVTNLASQLNEKLGKVSAAQRNAALSTIFGTDAIRSASVLYELGGKKLQGFIDANNEAGFAALQASKKLDNLNGDLQKLGASFQNDLIKSGSAGNDFLRSMTKSASGALDVFSDLPKPIQATALGVTGVSAAVTAAGAAFLLLTPKIAAARTQMKDLNLTGKGLALTFGKGAALTLGLSAVAGGLANLGAQGTVNASQLEQAALRVKGSYKNLDKAFPSSGVFDFGGGGAKASLETLDGFLGKTNQVAANFLDGATAALTFGQAGTHLGDVFKSNEETFAATGTALAGLAKQDYSASTNSFNRLNKQLGGGADNAEKLIRHMPDYNAELVELASKAGVAATEQNKLSIATGRGGAADALRIALAAEHENATALNRMSGAATSAKVDISALSKTIAGFGGAALDARSAERAFEQAVDDATAAVKKNGRTAIDHGKQLDISTQAGRDNEAALDGIASAASAAASKIVEQTGSTKQAAAAIRQGRKDFIAAAVQMGLNRTAAGKLADQLGLIPSNVTTAFKLSGAGGVIGQIAAIKSAMNNLNGTRADVYVQGRVSGLTDAQASRVARNAGFAKGGAIDGPGPKGKDSVLAWLAPGEHVLTTRDVDRLGGQQGVYAFRAGLGGLAGFAKGGAIGESESAAARAKSQIATYQAKLDQAKRHLKAEQRAEDAAQKRYDAIDGTKKNRAIKQRAKADLAAAKKQSDAAQKSIDAIEKKLDTATQKRSDANSTTVDLRNDREDFQSTQRRATDANPIDPLSYIDQLRSMSRDSKFSQSRRSSYEAATVKYEASLVKNTALLDKATTSLNDFKSAADSMRSSIASSISGGYQLSSVAGTQRTGSTVMRDGISFATTTSGVSADAINAYYRTGKQDSASFAADLKTLAGRGVNGQLLAELAGYGVAQGAPIAKALVGATSGQLNSINTDYAAIQGSAADAAGTVTDVNYKALIDAGQADTDRLTKQIADDGEKLRKLIASAFGLSGYAVGTSSTTAGWHLMGERGPELVHTGGGGQVFTNQQTAGMFARQATAAANSRIVIQIPDTITIQDASGFKVPMRTVATETFHSEMNAGAVRLIGA